MRYPIAIALILLGNLGVCAAQTAPKPLRLPALKPLEFQKPALTGDPIADIKTDLKQAGVPTGLVKNKDGTVQCNFNIFANLNPKNLVATVQACVSDVNSTFEPDVAAALASAQAYAGAGSGSSNGQQGDVAAIQCLQPALAIVQAGIARPAVPAVPAQPAVPATATTPAIAAVAAVPAVPAYSAGPIVLFQKFREFVLSGGPQACNSWIQGTVQGAVLPAVGAVAGTAAAVGVATGGVIP